MKQIKMKYIIKNEEEKSMINVKQEILDLK